MMSRFLILCFALIIAAFLGWWLGDFISYWFVDSIMRLHLSWGEYLQKLPANLLTSNPISNRILKTVIYCRFAAMITMILLTLYGYDKTRNRK